MPRSKASGRSGTKRKAAESTQRQMIKRRKTEKKPFRFLELPGELRNLVYEEVAQQQMVILPRGRLLVPSGLVAVSKQIGGEYRAILLIAGNIHAHVSNFDFRHVVTFINKLSELELKTLPNITTSSRRTIKIDLQVTRSDRRSDEELLYRWLNRTGHTIKKGTKLDIIYTIRSVAEQGNVRMAHRTVVSAAHQMVERYERQDAYNARTADEARKVKAALRSVLNSYRRIWDRTMRP